MADGGPLNGTRILRDAGRGRCYRCWQVGRPNVKATCVVVYNVGTPRQWAAESCESCFELDRDRFPETTRKVLGLVGGSK
jgi:hypothetical protein